MKKMFLPAIAALSGMLLMAGCSSFERLQGAAERGDPAAQFALAEHYRAGDPTLSAIWLRRSAEQGYPRAMVELGKYCRDGYGVERDRDAAIEWWRKAALEKKNLEAAQLLLLPVQGRKHQDRNRRLPADPLAYAKAVDLRQHQIQENQVIGSLLKPCQSLYSISRRRRLIPRVPQIRVQKLLDIRLILYN